MSESGQDKRAGDYEEAEEAAVKAGKEQIEARMKCRQVGPQGFFLSMHQSSKYPDYYKIDTVDGVGTKLFLAILMNKFDTVGQDGVAMNANDAFVLGSVEPDTLTLYFACQERIEKEKMGELMNGVIRAYAQCDVSDIIPGAEQINIGKLETASLDEMIGAPVKGLGVDLCAKMVCFIKKDRVPQVNPQPGDQILGFQSSGLHSNGFTSARTILLTPEVEYRDEFKPLYIGRLRLDSTVEGDGRALGEVLLEPTILYPRAMALLARDIPGTYGINITGNGFKNFNRAGKDVAYVIDQPIKPHPIFHLIQQEAEAAGKPLSDEKMHTKFNMGLGYAAILPKDVDPVKALRIANEAGYLARIIGHVDRHTSADGLIPTIIYRPDRPEPIELRGY